MSKQRRQEQLLVEREDPYFKQRITDADLKVGDIFYEHFSTTSPPCYVTNAFKITKIDHIGAWGVLVHSDVSEMSISEV